jgi:small-conductance mechanosensitive channel
MPDRSLLFFYGLVFAAVIYFVVKFRKDITKKDGLINIASSLVIAIVIMFLLNSDLSATGILIALFSFLAAGFIFLCVAILLKDVYSTKKYTLTAIKRIKTENSIDLKDMPEFKSGIFCYKKSWYAIYSPSLNLLEIGVNAFDSQPEFGKKFTVRTLSKRAITFVPEVIPDEVNDDTELFGQLVIFCEISAKNQIMAENYIEAIKNGSSTPWLISVPDKTP